jgi:hypothetical protein
MTKKMKGLLFTVLSKFLKVPLIRAEIIADTYKSAIQTIINIRDSGMALYFGITDFIGVSVGWFGIFYIDRISTSDENDKNKNFYRFQDELMLI